MAGRDLGRQSLNTTRDYGFRLYGPEGATSLAGLFTGSETFAARLWLGDDSSVSAPLTAEWAEDSPGALANPIVKLTVARADIEDLEPGVYFVEVILDPDSHDIAVLPDGSTLELVDATSAATDVAVIPSLDDIRTFVPWAEQIVRKHPDLDANLIDFRLTATDWVIGTVRSRAVAAWSPPVDSPAWYSWIVPRLDAAYWGSGGTTPDSTMDERLADLDAAIEAGGIVVSPEIRRAAAMYAAAEALNGILPDGKSPYPALTSNLKRRATAILGATTIRVTVEDEEDPDNDYDAEFKP
jgi:hypothetical protein